MKTFFTWSVTLFAALVLSASYGADVKISGLPVAHVAHGAEQLMFNSVSAGVTNTSSITVDELFTNRKLSGTTVFNLNGSMDTAENINLNGYFKSYSHLELDGATPDSTGRSVAYFTARSTNAAADNVITIRNFGAHRFTAYAGFNDDHSMEMAFGMGNTLTTNLVYGNNLFIEGNPNVTDGFTNSPGTIMSVYGNENGDGYQIHSLVHLWPDLSIDLNLGSTADSTHYGQPAMHIDPALGIVNLSVTSSNTFTGAGTLAISGNTATFSTTNSIPFKIGDIVIPSGGDQYMIYGVTDATHFTVWDYTFLSTVNSDSIAATSYTYQRREQGWQSINDPARKNFGGIIDPNGFPTYIGYDNAFMYLLTIHNSTGYLIANNDGVLNIHDTRRNANPVSIGRDGTTTFEKVAGNAAGLTNYQGGFYEPWKWSKPANILESTQSWEDNNVNESAVWTNATVFGMFYTGGNIISNHAALGYAYCPINSDPTVAANWTKVTGPVLGLGHGGEGINAARSTVKQIGTNVYVYYAPYTNGASTHTFCVATLSGSNTLTKVGVVLTLSGDFQIGNCWMDTNAAGTFCMGYEYLDGFNNYVCGLATNVLGPTNTFTALLTNDTSLDVGLKGYSAGTAQRIGGVWHNWYHVQDSLPSYVIHAYTANATPTNWTLEPWNPIFTPSGMVTHGFACDQVADVKTILEVNGWTYIFFDCDYNGSPNQTIASCAAAKFGGPLATLVAPGTMLYPRPISVYGTNAVNQSTTSGVNTVVNMKTIAQNSGMVYDTVSNCAICLTPGWYNYATHARHASDPGSGATLAVVTNFNTSLPVDNDQHNQTTWSTFNVVGKVPLTMKEKIAVTIYQQSGSSKDINDIDTWSGPKFYLSWEAPLQ